MPELAEVEFYRRQWDGGLGGKILRVHLHPAARVFRGADLSLADALEGRRLESSEARGKQMVFRFSGGLWAGIHLGMSGSLSAAPGGHLPARHDHLVLFQKGRALVFNDPRQFGRVRLDHGPAAPAWWSAIAPAVTSAAFTLERMRAFLVRRPKLALKGALLCQEGFPGIGNWMADEILWRAGLDPRRPCSKLSLPGASRLWRETRFVARAALRKIGVDFSDPPPGWFFHQRWKPGGRCPKHKTALGRETVAGRTTAWCSKCQR